MLKRNGNGATTSGDGAIGVMQGFCDRSGNSLGYLLLQKLTRKYKGVHKAREIFANTQRNLCIRNEDIPCDDSSPVVDNNTDIARRSTIDDQIETSESKNKIEHYISSVIIK